MNLKAVVIRAIILAIPGLLVLGSDPSTMPATQPATQPTTIPVHTGQRVRVALGAVDDRSGEGLRINSIGFPAENGRPNAWNVRIYPTTHEIEFTDAADLPLDIESRGYETRRINLNSSSAQELIVRLKRIATTQPKVIQE